MAKILEIPIMTPFTVPQDSTIESLKKGIPMSSCCDQHLITSNFGMKVSSHLSLLGGFLLLGDDYSSEAGVEAVAELARATGHKFRLGTPLEALAYKKSDATHPEHWVVLSKVSSDKVLYWRDWNRVPRFLVRAWHGDWFSKRKIFVVEEPEV